MEEAQTRTKKWSWWLKPILWLCHPAIACFELPLRAAKSDVEIAIWLWRNDPVASRGTACAMCYVANGGQKAALVSFLPLMLLFGMVFFIPNLPLNLWGRCVAGAVAAAVVAFGGAGVVSIIALSIAYRSGVRVWIDENPNLDFAKSNWPPAHSEKNQAALMALLPIFCVLISVLVVTPDRLLYQVAACLLMLVPFVLWVGHRTIARSIEDCYGGNG